MEHHDAQDHQDIWSDPNQLSEIEQAANRLDELLRKWSATGTLQSVRNPSLRTMRLGIRQETI